MVGIQRTIIVCYSVNFICFSHRKQDLPFSGVTQMMRNILVCAFLGCRWTGQDTATLEALLHWYSRANFCCGLCRQRPH